MTNVPEVIDLYTLAHTRSMCVVSIEKKSPESEKNKEIKVRSYRIRSRNFRNNKSNKHQDGGALGVQLQIENGWRGYKSIDRSVVCTRKKPCSFLFYFLFALLYYI